VASGPGAWFGRRWCGLPVCGPGCGCGWSGGRGGGWQGGGSGGWQGGGRVQCGARWWSVLVPPGLKGVNRCRWGCRGSVLVPLGVLRECAGVARVVGGVSRCRWGWWRRWVAVWRWWWWWGCCGCRCGDGGAASRGGSVAHWVSPPGFVGGARARHVRPWPGQRDRSGPGLSGPGPRDSGHGRARCLGCPGGGMPGASGGWCPGYGVGVCGGWGARCFAWLGVDLGGSPGAGLAAATVFTIRLRFVSYRTDFL
jgi:hypothetical protein